MKGKSSLSSQSIPVLYIDLAVSKVVLSSHVWLGAAQGRGDEQVEASQHCQPKSVFTFLTEVQKSKHNGWLRQSRRTEAELIWFMLLLEPHLLLSAKCLLTLVTKGNGTGISSHLQHLTTGGENAISGLHLD